jgi:hypothetical protein
MGSLGKSGGNSLLGRRKHIGEGNIKFYVTYDVRVWTAVICFIIMLKDQ